MKQAKKGLQRRSARSVVVVGAGPVGSVCALALWQKGIPVILLEKEPAPVTDQRAASIHPTTLELLDQLGVTGRILDKGLISPTYRFHDRLEGRLIAEFDLAQLRDEFKFPFVLQYEQYKLTASITEGFADGETFSARFSHAVKSIEQTEDAVTVLVDHQGEELEIDASYVVACDGGRSTVRREAGIGFDGFTYPQKFIKIATTYDFASDNHDLSYRNYFSDPNEWCNLFKVRGENKRGLWRAIFPMQPDEPDEIALLPDAIEVRLQRFFPKAGVYEIEYVNVYAVSQRVAETFRKGRILLAGDSAHVNNPIGGMGMNGGIHDAINLAEKLAQVLKGQADESLLDKYSRQRRHAAIEFVQAQTIANKRLLEERDLKVRASNLQELQRIAENRDTARDYMRRASLAKSLESANEIE
jgi:3-(3-hydroxy-phenyl)propionate hydroxylase